MNSLLALKQLEEIFPRIPKHLLSLAIIFYKDAKTFSFLASEKIPCSFIKMLKISKNSFLVSFYFYTSISIVFNS